MEMLYQGCRVAFPMHTCSRESRPKTHRKKCLHGLSAAWPHHSRHLSIPLLPPKLFPAFTFQSSFILELWEAHGRECVLLHFCYSGYRQQANTQLFPSPSPEHSWLWHPKIYQCSSREKIQKYLNKQIHSVNATCGQTGPPKAHGAAP